MSSPISESDWQLVLRSARQWLHLQGGSGSVFINTLLAQRTDEVRSRSRTEVKIEGRNPSFIVIDEWSDFSTHQAGRSPTGQTHQGTILLMDDERRAEVEEFADNCTRTVGKHTLSQLKQLKTREEQEHALARLQAYDPLFRTEDLAQWRAEFKKE